MLTPMGISLGPMLLGFTLNTILFGIVLSQTLLYFSHYKSDTWWIKLFVAQLFVLDTATVVFELVYLYNAFVTKPGDRSTFHLENWIFSTVPAITGITSASVQLFFAWRIHILSSSVPTVYAIRILAVIGMLSGIGTSIAVNVVPTFSEFFVRFVYIVITWLSASAADNLLITATLVRLLRGHRTGFADTDHIIEKIIRITLHTGLLTTIWTMLDLSIYLVTTNGFHLVFTLPLAKLYTISLLSTLTSRACDADYRDFTVVNAPDQCGRRGSGNLQELIQINHRTEDTLGDSDIVSDDGGTKKVNHQTSALLCLVP